MSTPLPRSEFAVTQRYVYLNHASAGVLPLSSAAAIETFVHAHAEAGVVAAPFHTIFGCRSTARRSGDSSAQAERKSRS